MRPPRDLPQKYAPRPHKGKEGPARWKPKADSVHGHEHSGDGATWIYGTHAALAALANPKRKILEIFATRNAATALPAGVQAHIIDGEALSAKLPTGAVHQGVAVRTLPLEPMSIDKALPDASGIVLMLDQVSDPQNIGAMFRTAAAFGVRAIIQQDRKAPPITAALAKAAVGAIETVPDVRVVNVSQTLIDLAADGWTTIGLSGDAEHDLADVLDDRPMVLVLGTEGKGLRPLVAARCDILAKIPIHPNMESLNVSAATAIALYAASLAQKSTKRG
jgi:23S rRNA (guanosine2251-2'-O)-methyltransferase